MTSQVFDDLDHLIDEHISDLLDRHILSMMGINGLIVHLWGAYMADRDESESCTAYKYP